MGRSSKTKWHERSLCSIVAHEKSYYGERIDCCMRLYLSYGEHAYVRGGKQAFHSRDDHQFSATSVCDTGYDHDTASKWGVTNSTKNKLRFLLYLVVSCLAGVSNERVQSKVRFQCLCFLVFGACFRSSMSHHTSHCYCDLCYSCDILTTMLELWRTFGELSLSCFLKDNCYDVDQLQPSHSEP